MQSTFCVLRSNITLCKCLWCRNNKPHFHWRKIDLRRHLYFSYLLHCWSSASSNQDCFQCCLQNSFRTIWRRRRQYNNFDVMFEDVIKWIHRFSLMHRTHAVSPSVPVNLKTSSIKPPQKLCFYDRSEMEESLANHCLVVVHFNVFSFHCMNRRIVFGVVISFMHSHFLKAFSQVK
jgi:hypothetical protein